MSQHAVRKTIIQSVQTLLNGLQVAWPNKILKPTLDLWFAVNYIPNRTSSLSLGQLGEEEVMPILQIDIYSKIDTGESQQLSNLTSLESLYHAGKTLEFSGQEVTVVSSERSVSREVDNYFKTSLSIYFRARFTRPLLA